VRRPASYCEEIDILLLPSEVLEVVATAEPIYRLVTGILDPDRGPAQELAALYHERWKIETALDELKTHRRAAKIVLRSKIPDLVRREFYGLMMAHFAIRSLIHEAALKADEDPDQLSFLHAVRVCPAPSLFPPRKRKTFHDAVHNEILAERAAPSETGRNPAASSAR
jgi:hypothetical protein